MRSGRMRAVRLVGALAGLLLAAATPAAAAPADLDPTFGSGGLAPPAFSASSRFNALRLDAQGRIVAAGSVGSSPTAIQLARYTPEGQLDPTFGNGGTVMTPVAGGNAIASAVAIAPNGDIVVAGRSTVSGNLVFTLARYSPSGALVAGFGSGGIRQLVELGTFSFGTGVTVLPDGNIAAAGVDNGSPRFVVVRLGPTGLLDTTFDGDGIARPPAACGSNTSARGMVGEPDGAFVASGECLSGGRLVIALAKFKAGASGADAAVDSSFGSGGLTTIAFTPNFNEQQRGVARTADGRYLLSGQLQIGGSTSPETFRGAIARFDHSGTLDPTWGSGGKVQVAAPGGIGFSGLGELADGSVAASGFNAAAADGGWVVARFKQDGTPDPDFGAGGLAIGNPQGLPGPAFTTALVAQGTKPLVAGSLADATALARFGREDAASSGGGTGGGAAGGGGGLPLIGPPPVAGIARAGLPRSVTIDPRTRKGTGNATCQADPGDACAIAGRLQQGSRASKLATAARKRKRKATTVGSFAGRVPAGINGRVAFTVSRRALRKLVAAGKLKVRATGQVRNGAGASSPIAQPITLRVRKKA